MTEITEPGASASELPSLIYCRADGNNRAGSVSERIAVADLLPG